MDEEVAFTKRYFWEYWLPKFIYDGSCKVNLVYLKSPNYPNLSLERDCGADFPYDLDVSDLAKSWVKHLMDDVATFRDHIFLSKYTGALSKNVYTSTHSLFQETLQSSIKNHLWRPLMILMRILSIKLPRWCKMFLFKRILIHWLIFFLRKNEKFD